MYCLISQSNAVVFVLVVDFMIPVTEDGMAMITWVIAWLGM
jgi:hypothetical protein